MKYSITFQEKDYAKLVHHLFGFGQNERAAYILCKSARNEDENRLLVREIIPVIDEDVEESSPIHMKIKSISFLRAIKKADLTKHFFVFVHSHPKGYISHSKQDDAEEQQLFKTAHNRIKMPGVHASLVLSSPEKPIGRVWLEDGTTHSITVVKVLGDRFRFFKNESEITRIPDFFDRQVRAFGDDIQKLLQTLHVAIVGVGGTGSAVAEQLIRLGIGSVTISDPESFEKTNINRVYGSRISDEGEKKIQLISRLAKEIGLGTRILTIDKPVTFQSVVNKLKNVDVIFGCTDDQWGRSILTRMAVYYGLPVFDMGVKIDSVDGIIRSIEGRVTTLFANHACLFCRERINGTVIRKESMAVLDPVAFAQLVKDGYADELETPAPAVISFTSSIASFAVTELLHRLTGFMGDDRNSTEIIVSFDRSRIGRNGLSSKENCFCNDPNNIFRGDTSPLLDITWREE
jgi:molybdopterin/thiamine biosynthesis adenylyltransferase